MTSLPRRIAAVSLTAATLLAGAGALTTASAASGYFVGTGRDSYTARQAAYSQANAAGFTASQCDLDTETLAPHYYQATLTCTN
ncbi:hypothetical protein CFP65_0008 [Kitasatospora sp. MMS16-BH015]|uniref:hypothetical protein n=1 Tax=Kitasatospora sp. MMS16-BH015 TaxID=2018025 RepID=UPI000CA34F27|nr:hypothetical protein [Kitasatospora sp. MMS16-BH015]AUG74998.1 hypothetical protein CFP65_0008 [Kitasatospora sp. MMS16-BH015]